MIVEGRFPRIIIGREALLHIPMRSFYQSAPFAANRSSPFLQDHSRSLVATSSNDCEFGGQRNCRAFRLSTRPSSKTKGRKEPIKSTMAQRPDSPGISSDNTITKELDDNKKLEAPIPGAPKLPPWYYDQFKGEESWGDFPPMKTVHRYWVPIDETPLPYEHLVTRLSDDKPYHVCLDCGLSDEKLCKHVDVTLYDEIGFICFYCNQVVQTPDEIELYGPKYREDPNYQKNYQKIS